MQHAGAIETSKATEATGTSEPTDATTGTGTIRAGWLLSREHLRRDGPADSKSTSRYRWIGSRQR